MKFIIILMFLITIAFTITIIVVFVITGNEPSTLINGFFEFIKWEAAGTSVIKVSEYIGSRSKLETNSKLGEVVEDSANILDDTAELLRDVNDVSHGRLN